MKNWFRSHDIPVFHIASMARSGETLLLRCLDRHSRLTVVHNLAEQDSTHRQELFHFLQSWQPTRIPEKHALLKPLQLNSQQILILKQGVWEHPFPFNGIVLLRSPVACYASLRTYDCQTNGKSPDENWPLNLERLIRWLTRIEPALLDGFSDLEPIEQFATFYNRRISGLLDTGLPVVHYENLVSKPENTLRQVVAAIGVAFEPSILTSHLGYLVGSVGHGQHRLDQPISDRSVLKYMQVLGRSEFDTLKDRVKTVARRAGYSLEWGSNGLDPTIHEQVAVKAAE